MKKLGVIGGLGPMATVYFLELVTRMTDAATDQEHVEVLFHSKPSIPDRTSFILGLSDENPCPEIKAVARELISGGAEVIAMPCITAGYFAEELNESLETPIIDIVDETISYLKDRNIESVGIMATDGSLKADLFKKACDKYDIKCIYPDELHQKNVMHIIYKNIKATKPVEMDRFRNVESYLKDQGAQVIVLGCTELSVLKRDNVVGSGFIDAMEVLAKVATESCATLKDEYRELITK